ncbi:MAG: hypothetical protein IJW70_01955 [Clostridia bacterium]|nr:hypothetical protein [Clostridia bacterium]
MNRSRLKVTERQGTITVKKRMYTWEYALFGAVLLTGILACLLLPAVRNTPMLWIVTVAAELCSTAVLVVRLLWKMVIDREKRQIILHHLNKEVHGFDQIKEIKTYHKSGGSEENDEDKVIFLLHDGREVAFNTLDEQEARELAALLTGIIFS